MFFLLIIFFSNRGLITFENKTYVLEPLKNATDRYRLFPAETLAGVPGSCGSHGSPSRHAAASSRPPPSRTRETRVGETPGVAFLGTWGMQLGTPGARTPGGIFPSGRCVWGWSHPVNLGVMVARAERHQTATPPSQPRTCPPALGALELRGRWRSH